MARRVSTRKRSAGAVSKGEKKEEEEKKKEKETTRRSESTADLPSPSPSPPASKKQKKQARQTNKANQKKNKNALDDESERPVAEWKRGQFWWLDETEWDLDRALSLVNTLYRKREKPTSAQDDQSALANNKLDQRLEVHQYLEKLLIPTAEKLLLEQEQQTSSSSSSWEERKEQAPLWFWCMRMVCEKNRQRVPVWSGFFDKQEVLGSLFRACVSFVDVLRELEAEERAVLLEFFIIGFRSLENEGVRGNLLKLVSLQVWRYLAPNRLEQELRSNAKLHKYWNKILKREKKEEKKAKDKDNKEVYVPLEEKPEAKFFPKLFNFFMERVDQLPGGGDAETETETETKINGEAAAGRMECELFLQLVIELLSQLPTRRFVRTFLSNQGFLSRCKRVALVSTSSGRVDLFGKLLAMVDDLMTFEVDDQDGSPVSDEDKIAQHYEYLQKLQRMAFKHYPKLNEFALANCKRACDETFLKEELSKLDFEQVKTFVTEQCRILDPESKLASDRESLESVFFEALKRPTARSKYLEMLPLYPTEETLLDEDLVPESNHRSAENRLLSSVSGLPRMNLQFLTMRDYLVRNFKLLQLEAAYEIREDIKDVLPRLGAHLDEDDKVKFSGWARMASEVNGFRIVDVGAANLGEEKPSHVHAEVEIDLRKIRRQDIRNEWDAIKQHDVLFLLVLNPQEYSHGNGFANGSEGPSEWQGLTHVRGCEVIQIRDEKGKTLNDLRFEEGGCVQPSGSKRTLQVALDSTQYHQDVASNREGSIYGSFSLLIRRGAKESNFKAVLECIRDLAKEDISLPHWLNDVFLGYGDPTMSHFTSMPDEQELEIDFRDTFKDANHIQRSFPGWKVRMEGGEGISDPHFKVKLDQPVSRAESDDPSPVTKLAAGSMVVQAYENKGSKTKKSSVEFTDVQTSAILSGVQKGLTMIVGPPGTGKTDVATQILDLLYHNYPNQRILLITHSNQALNDLFMKIMNRDVPARYLLRLGMGEQELETDLEFSRLGRVNAMLERRLRLLSEVERLARDLGLREDYASTCETCAHFWLVHVLSRWEKFRDVCKKNVSAAVVAEEFPFKAYFESGKALFASENSLEENMNVAQECFSSLKEMFVEIEECRPFELLESQSDRLNYLMTKQAKIVAMTCTYAAMKRADFVKLALQFDSIVMEESAQVLDIETLIPMRLQRDLDGLSRLKRCVLIGDHNQLPPVVKNMTLRQASNLEQSLFTRLIRLGTPFIELNAQGRCRSSIAELYNWKYEKLGNLPSTESSEFELGNPGFKFDYQLINVEDYNGQGENAPAPHFIQNLGEAEYAVTLFQHMRLLGYPASKITILTTYNGQKALINDVIERRCAYYPLFGRPAKVETVDRFQGQQNDYVIVSLVRTKAVGHIRDVRRLVVAMSRARLGLFVLGRARLFSSCLELKPTFSKLLERPTELHIIPDETYPTERKHNGKHKSKSVSMEELTKMVVEKVQGWEQEQQMQMQQ